MQTFLPYPDFILSASCLDRARLGKQRLEVVQLFPRKIGVGWRNHPAYKMWDGYHVALASYGVAVCLEWRRRGYVDNMLPTMAHFLDDKLVLPPWFGDDDFHAAHRSNLLRKAPDHYSQFKWTEPNDLPYVWPV